MVYPVNYQKQNFPAYSGITINISNPTLNAAPQMTDYPACYSNQNIPVQPNFTVDSIASTQKNSGEMQQYQNYSQYKNPREYGLTNPNTYTTQELNGMNGINNNPNTNGAIPFEYNSNLASNPQIAENKPLQTQNGFGNTEIIPQNNQPNGIQPSYPPQYYLNNYNYIQNGEKGNSQTMAPSDPFANNTNNQTPLNNIQAMTEENMDASNNIISNLDARVAEQKNLEKNGVKTRVVALTNEYIMSLENYLNNPNSEIRLMASKEVLKRLDEDKERFNDAALNALLNKMLQDPNKLVRIAAMSAFSSQLASGNDFTVKLLKDVQANPNSDKEDVLQAADILLKMSSSTQIKYVPAKPKKESGNKELEASQKQIEQLRGQLQKYKEKEIEQMLQIPQGKQ